MSDLIRREDVLAVLCFSQETGQMVCGDLRKLLEEIKAIPSAEPERKKGEWCRHYTRPNVYEDLYWHCSACGYKCGEDYANVYYYYCPNCGAYMRR